LTHHSQYESKTKQAQLHPSSGSLLISIYSSALEIAIKKLATLNFLLKKWEEFMAQGVGYKHGNTIIPFDTGRSYVVCDMPERQEKYKIHDTLGRSEEERKFLVSFERIFYAAAVGDLKKCKEIVEEEKFGDIDAYSIGKFGNQVSGKSLDYVSPRQVAQMNGHTHVTDYFAKHFGGGVQPEKKWDQLLDKPENRKTYEFHKTSYKQAPFDMLVNAIQVRILSTHDFEKQIEMAPQLEKMSYDKLFETLKLCCTEEFTRKGPYDTEKRMELYALRDVFAETQFQKTETATADDIFCENSEDVKPTPGCIFFRADCDPEFEFLNNEYATSFEFGGRDYLSATSAYIAQQFLHYPELLEQLTTLNAEEAHALSLHHYKEWEAHTDEWFPKRKETMAHILRAKFGQNPSLKQQLLLTGNFYLSSHSEKKGEDPFWSDNADGSGENRLGNLLMGLRKEYGGRGEVAKPDNYSNLLKNF
jgi:predicted NAD-dependent protein-ADP-ribosyltransferase YbiA (DUF1768 family)